VSNISLKAALKLLKETQDTMAADPRADVTLLYRGSLTGERDGEATIGGAASGPVVASGLPIEASLQGGFSRHWESVAVGEFVVHVHRPAVRD